MNYFFIIDKLSLWQDEMASRAGFGQRSLETLV